MKPIRSILLLIPLLTVLSCGYVEETGLRSGSVGIVNPRIESASPADGTKVDTLGTITITYSEEVTGADEITNYTLSGSGVGSLSLDSVTETGTYTYTLTVSGSPGDGNITLTVSNITDVTGNPMNANTVSYTGWWDTDWQYRRTLTFDNSGQPDLTDFAVLVRLNGSRVDYSATQTQGQDIRFLIPSGTVLDHEIERWNESGESLIWVRVPLINGGSSGDYIRMYYGNSGAPDGQNPENVWDDNFMAVLHMNQEPDGSTGDITDSARNLVTVPVSNYGHGTSSGMSSVDRVSGAIGYALNFDGNDDWIDPADNDNGFFHDALFTITFETWVRCADSSTQTLYDEGGSTNGFYMGIQSQQIRVVTRDSSNEQEINYTYPDNGAYYYAAGTYDNGTLALYVNGNLINSIATGYAGGEISTHSGMPGFGSSPDSNADGGGSGEHLNGIMDEIRLSDIPRSSDWIMAQYLSMNDSFITFGTEE